MSTPAWVRFVTKRRVLPNGCHEWTAYRDPSGYGRMSMGDEQYAHRIAHILFRGPIPRGMTIDHFMHPDGGCIGPACVNPAHLRVATQQENILRSRGPSALAAVATHCPQGHAYEGTNLYVDPKGARRCRACNRIRQRRLNAERRAA